MKLASFSGMIILILITDISLIASVTFGSPDSVGLCRLGLRTVDSATLLSSHLSRFKN